MRVLRPVSIFALAAAVLGILTTPTRAFAATETYFHWGDISGNQTLLEKGGVQAQEHWTHLGDGTSAALNEAVLEQTREWYLKANRRDAAGAGFYMSPSFFDSRQFGNDLLMIEVENDSGKPLEVFDPSIKTKADLALDAANPSVAAAAEPSKYADLPLVSRYFPNAGWRVISRDLNAEERKHLRITYRVPVAEDVETIWKSQFNEPELTLVRLQLVATLVLKNDATVPARILYHQLLFDRAFDTLLEHATKAPSSIDDYFNSFNPIFKAFEEYMPNDTRTLKLGAALVAQAKTFKGPFQSSALLELIARMMKHLPDDERFATLEWVFSEFTPALIDQRFDLIIEMTKAAMPALDQSQRLKVRQALLKKTQASKTELPREALDAIFGRPLGESLWTNAFLNRTKSLVEAFSMPHNGNRSSNRMDPSAASKALREQARVLTRIPADAKLVEKFMSVVKTASPQDRTREDLGAIALMLYDLDPALKNYVHTEFAWFEKNEERARNSTRGDDDPAFLKRLRNLAIRNSIDAQSSWEVYDYMRAFEGKPELSAALKRRLQLLSRNRAEYQTGPVSEYLNDLLKEPGMTAANFENRAHEILRDFPESARQFVGGLKYLKHYTVLPIQWARIEAAANEVAQRQVSMTETRAREAYSQMLNVYKTGKRSTDHLPSFETFLKAYLNTNQNIAGSSEYSILSRTFALVDVPFVFEDLRHMNASKPFMRFNEKLDHSTQPAWENFLSAWTVLSDQLWMRQASIENPQIKWAQPNIGDAQELLVATHVDGSEIKSSTSDWDRAKYKTFMPEAEWTDWNLDPQATHIDRYFDVTKVEGGFDLHFKSVADLRTRNPGLGRYTKATYAPSYQISQFVRFESVKLKDPVQRAARILFLMTRLHPFENGNGRLGRLWATLELVHAGLPMPMGLPTNDFLMSQKHIELEVRKSLELGRLWQNMLKKAAKDGVPADDFFQKVYRGSALEGLSLINLKSTSELADFVTYLKNLKQAPEWARELTHRFESALHGKKLNELDETTRYRMQEQLWHPVRSCEGLFK